MLTGLTSMTLELCFGHRRQIVPFSESIDIADSDGTPNKSPAVVYPNTVMSHIFAIKIT